MEDPTRMHLLSACARPRRLTCHQALLLAVAVASAGSAGAVQASAQLAADKGCINCHGDPPKRKTPSFSELARSYAQYQDQPGAEQALAEQLRKGSFFGHIDAHTRLSAEEARALVRWLIDGAR